MVVKLRVLMAEDSEHDAELVLRALRSGGYQLLWNRIETEEAMRGALEREPWDVVLSDWSMPRFSAREALEVLKKSGLDLPFIIVSGTIGEDTATEALRAGAHDFLLKDKLARLVPAMERELRDADVRRQRRETERALRVADARFRTLVESMDEMVYTLDVDRRYDGVFGRWVERSGLTPEFFLGHTHRELLGEEGVAPHEAAIARAFSGERVLYEWSTATTTGERWFQTSLSPILSPQGEITGVVGVGREITEQRRVQAQLVVSDRLASVGMLAAGVAHEINNPLSAVLANLDLAIRDLREDYDPEEVLAELKDAQESAERIREISRDLRMFSRAEEEKRGPVDLQRVLESAIRMARNEIRHRATVETSYGHKLLIEGNESRLGQVFLNLIVNAAQAIPIGQIDGNQIRVSTSTDARGWAVVGIADTGEGMAPEVVKRLFTPFFTTKPAGLGTGLGLSICQRIITAHGGEISVESTVGRGTIFTVCFPAARLGEKRAREDREPVVERASRRGRVLVVDDEPVIIAVLRRLLSEHEVVGLGDAREALARLSGGEHFDVILCDMMMPQMTGMELHRDLLRTSPALADRLIFLTGGAFGADVRNFLDTVDNLRIEKPFDSMAVRALINDRLKTP